MFKRLKHKIQRWWVKLRLQPIRVFCFHQVSDSFDSASMWSCDWISSKDLKYLINMIQADGYTFISLQEAHCHISNDIFRFRKYAVLTADDGSKTLDNIIPWLRQKKIPLTIFINGRYLDGITYREAPSEKYLTQDEVFALADATIEIGNHGWDHRDLRCLSTQDFEQSISRNVNLLSIHPRYISFWAYPYGTHSRQSDEILLRQGLIPVLMNGCQNYNNSHVINRELIDKYGK